MMAIPFGLASSGSDAIPLTHLLLLHHWPVSKLSAANQSCELRFIEIAIINRKRVFVQTNVRRKVSSCLPPRRLLWGSTKMIFVVCTNNTPSLSAGLWCRVSTIVSRLEWDRAGIPVWEIQFDTDLKESESWYASNAHPHIHASI